MNLRTFKANVRDFGASKAISDVVLRGMNRIVVLRILKAIKIERINANFLHPDSAYRGLFLSERMLRHFAADPDSELSNPFLDRAFSKGDECYGFLCGSALAAYGWYSKQPTDLDVPGLQLQFDEKYVYMYKGFTAADHRGNRGAAGVDILGAARADCRAARDPAGRDIFRAAAADRRSARDSAG